MSLLYRIKAGVLIPVLLAALAWPAHAAAPGKVPVIAVIPALDGDSDEAAEAAGGKIAAALAVAGGFSVVEQGLVSDVLRYSEEKKIPEPTVVVAARADLEKSKEAFFNFHYTDARALLDRTLSSLESDPSLVSNYGDLFVDAYVSRAVVAKSGNETGAAKNFLSKAAKINPLLDLSVEEYPPGLISIYKDAAGEMRKAGTGELSVITKPPAADVYINGIHVGRSPLVLREIPSGFYAVRISAGKYGTVARVAHVRNSQTFTIDEKLSWQKDRAAGEAPASSSGSEIGEALRIAGLIKADKSIVVDVDGARKNKTLTARMVDARFGAGQVPVKVLLNGDDGDVRAYAEITETLARQATADIANDPAANIDPKGVGEPVLLGKRKRDVFRSPVFWGVVGAVAAGALGGGLAAAMSDGGGNTGSVRVEFR